MTFLMGPALLFCPADRPERYTKAAQRADAVILDLEDAVAPEAKQRARGAILAQIADGPELDPTRTIIRVNAVGGEEFERDLHMLKHTPYRTVMLAKTASREHVRALADYHVLALCETASGVLNAEQIAAEPNVVGLMWGAEDLVVSLGGTSSRNDDGRYRAVALHARSTVLLAAAVHGKAAVDAVYVNIPDIAGLEAEARDAAASGFASKACIHPNQVAAVRAAYAPAAEEIAAAKELLEAASGAGSGVFQFKGKMVDEPVLRHAEQILRRAHV